jgi:hypothetical protein
MKERGTTRKEVPSVPWLSLANIFAMVCRVIPAGRVSVEKEKCFVKKLGGHRGKRDAARSQW